jgi:hypothetical protein
MAAKLKIEKKGKGKCSNKKRGREIVASKKE